MKQRMNFEIEKKTHTKLKVVATIKNISITKYLDSIINSKVQSDYKEAIKKLER